MRTKGESSNCYVYSIPKLQTILVSVEKEVNKCRELMNKIIAIRIPNAIDIRRIDLVGKSIEKLENHLKDRQKRLHLVTQIKKLAPNIEQDDPNFIYMSTTELQSCLELAKNLIGTNNKGERIYLINEIEKIVPEHRRANLNNLRISALMHILNLAKFEKITEPNAVDKNDGPSSAPPSPEMLHPMQHPIFQKDTIDRRHRTPSAPLGTRRRLTKSPWCGRSLIERFIRESIRCQES